MCWFSVAHDDAIEAADGMNLRIENRHSSKILANQSGCPVCVKDGCVLQIMGLGAAFQSKYSLVNPNPVVVFHQEGNVTLDRVRKDTVTFDNGEVANFSDLPYFLNLIVLHTNGMPAEERMNQPENIAADEHEDEMAMAVVNREPLSAAQHAAADESGSLQLRRRNRTRAVLTSILTAFGAIVPIRMF